MTPNRILIAAFFLLTVVTTLTSGNDDDENFYYANNNNKFLFNRRKNCQLNNYYDVDYFKCRLCDPNFNLIATETRKFDTKIVYRRFHRDPPGFVALRFPEKCACDNNSTEVFEYDNILRRPICEKGSGRLAASACSIRFVNATKFSSLRKSVRVFRNADKRSCRCDEKTSDNYRGQYCIKSELLKDLKNHQFYKKLPLTQTLNLSQELKYIVFFCKVLHQRSYCNYLANICTLTQYDLDKNGPCFIFHKQQNQQSAITIDESSNEGSEFDGGEKLKPFLFFKSQKYAKNLFEKFIDFNYRIKDVSEDFKNSFKNINFKFLL